MLLSRNVGIKGSVIVVAFDGTKFIPSLVKILLSDPEAGRGTKTKKT
jgi:hypothetical protein